MGLNEFSILTSTEFNKNYLEEPLEIKSTPEYHDSENEGRRLNETDTMYDILKLPPEIDWS